MTKNSASKLLIIIGLIVAVPLLPGIYYICAVLFASLFGVHGETQTFQPQIEDAFKRADVVFVEHGLCKVWHYQCLDKNTIFAGGTIDSLTVWVYGVSDPKLLDRVKQIFVDEYQSTPGIKHISISAYAISKSEELKFPILQRPIAHPILKFTAAKD